MIDTIIEGFKGYEPYINDWEKLRRSSVVIPLVNVNGEEHVMFQLRAKHMKTQPGEVSFPGGGIDGDETPLQAAKREMIEELGIEEINFKIIAPLDIFTTPFNILIHPFLGYINDVDLIKINENEVDHVFVIPLSYLLTYKPTIFNNEVLIKRNDKFPYDLIPQGENYKFKVGNYDSVFYIYKDYVVWGITAKILENFLIRYKELVKLD